MSKLYPEPNLEDIKAAQELGCCPYCGDGAVVLSAIGPRCRCRACRARWLDNGDQVIQVPHQDPARCVEPLTTIAPTTIMVRAKTVTGARNQIIDKIVGEVERFKRMR